MTRLNADVKAFTVGTPGDPSDESAQAAEIANRLGIAHEVVTLDAGGEPALAQLGEAFSEPFASQSALGLMRVSAAIKPLATVLLTGDGGDDVYLGYPYFYNAWRAQRLARQLPSVTPQLWQVVRPIFQASSRTRRAKNFLDYTIGGLGAYTRVRDGLPYFDR
jgi:asparagine synthase (glutamine-hydrolysing)